MLEPPLSQAEVARIERYSVESQRDLYTDEELWAWLQELNDEHIENLKLLPVAYYNAHSDAPDRAFWRRRWEALATRVNDTSLADLIVWHLVKRGDRNVEDWVRANEELNQKISRDAANEAWRTCRDY